MRTKQIKADYSQKPFTEDPLIISSLDTGGLITCTAAVLSKTDQP